MAGKLGPAALLSEDEVRALLGACSRRAPTGVRDCALITLLWRTGLRISEALALEAARDVQLSGARPTLRVRDSKTPSGRRTVAIRAEAVEAIDRWLVVREQLNLGRRGRLFCTLDGKGLAQSQVRAMLRRRARRAGLDVRVHPHAFRATALMEAYRAGIGLPVIRDMAGHANLGSTDAYLKRLEPTEAIDAVLALDDPKAALLARLDNDTAARLLAVLGS
jgi:integrase/recombinase XerD